MGRKQHYIPQFYLKNFSDERKKVIGLYRFEIQKFLRSASIKDIAYRNNLYDDNDVIEKALAEYEGKWKQTIDIFLGKNITNKTLTMIQENTEKYIYDLIKFIAVTEARTTQSGDAISNIYQKMENQLSPSMDSETHKQYFGELEEFYKHPNIIPIEVALNILPMYDGLDLLVINNITKQAFITSDVPIVNINPYYTIRNCHTNYGLASMGLIKILPISQQICICLYDRNIYKRRTKDCIWDLRSKRIVDQINELIIANAYEQIFFSINEKEQYIRRLCERWKCKDNKGRIEFHGKDKHDFILIYGESIHTPFLLPCLQMKRTSKKIPIPSNSGGLIRPEVKSICDDKFAEDSPYI